MRMERVVLKVKDYLSISTSKTPVPTKQLLVHLNMLYNWGPLTGCACDSGCGRGGRGGCRGDRRSLLLVSYVFLSHIEIGPYIRCTCQGSGWCNSQARASLRQGFASDSLRGFRGPCRRWWIRFDLFPGYITFGVSWSPRFGDSDKGRTACPTARSSPGAWPLTADFQSGRIDCCQDSFHIFHNSAQSVYQSIHYWREVKRPWWCEGWGKQNCERDEFIRHLIQNITNDLLEAKIIKEEEIGLSTISPSRERVKVYINTQLTE